jgi:hypothetical protein
MENKSEEIHVQVLNKTGIRKFSDINFRMKYFEAL